MGSAEALTTQQIEGLNDFDDPGVSRQSFLTDNVVDPLHTFNEAGEPIPSKATGPFFLPRWQTSPVLETSMANENLLENEELADLVMTCLESRSAVLGGFHLAPPGGASDTNPTTAFFATIASIAQGEEREYLGDPMSHVVFPIFQYLNDTDRGKIVGIIKATLHWQDYLQNTLSATDYGYQVVIENECDEADENIFTYQVDGPNAKVVGLGDRHDRQFSQYLVDGYFSKQNIEDGTSQGLRFHQDSCPYVFHVYPTQDDYDKYVTALPAIISLSISAIFVFAIGMFLFYDRLVERRQKIVLAKATQSTAIISSLFVSTGISYAFCASKCILTTIVCTLRTAKASPGSFACIGNRQEQQTKGRRHGHQQLQTKIVPQWRNRCWQSKRPTHCRPVSSLYRHVCRYLWIYRVVIGPRACSGIHFASNCIPEL
jgi:hypothetical protein